MKNAKQDYVKNLPKFWALFFYSRVSILILCQATALQHLKSVYSNCCLQTIRLKVSEGTAIQIDTISFSTQP